MTSLKLLTNLSLQINLKQTEKKITKTKRYCKSQCKQEKSQEQANFAPGHIIHCNFFVINKDIILKCIQSKALVI